MAKIKPPCVTLEATFKEFGFSNHLKWVLVGLALGEHNEIDARSIYSALHYPCITNGDDMKTTLTQMSNNSTGNEFTIFGMIREDVDTRVLASEFEPLNGVIHYVESNLFKGVFIQESVIEGVRDRVIQAIAEDSEFSTEESFDLLNDIPTKVTLIHCLNNFNVLANPLHRTSCIPELLVKHSLEKLYTTNKELSPLTPYDAEKFANKVKTDTDLLLTISHLASNSMASTAIPLLVDTFIRRPAIANFVYHLACHLSRNPGYEGNELEVGVDRSQAITGTALSELLSFSENVLSYQFFGKKLETNDSSEDNEPLAINSVGHAIIRLLSCIVSIGVDGLQPLYMYCKADGEWIRDLDAENKLREEIGSRGMEAALEEKTDMELNPVVMSETMS